MSNHFDHLKAFDLLAKQAEFCATLLDRVFEEKENSQELRQNIMYLRDWIAEKRYKKREELLTTELKNL